MNTKKSPYVPNIIDIAEVVRLVNLHLFHREITSGQQLKQAHQIIETKKLEKYMHGWVNAAVKHNPEPHIKWLASLDVEW